MLERPVPVIWGVFCTHSTVACGLQAQIFRCTTTNVDRRMMPAHCSFRWHYENRSRLPATDRCRAIWNNNLSYSNSILVCSKWCELSHWATIKGKNRLWARIEALEYPTIWRNANVWSWNYKKKKKYINIYVMVVIYDRRLMSMKVWVLRVFFAYVFEVKLRFMRFSCVLFWLRSVYPIRMIFLLFFFILAHLINQFAPSTNLFFLVAFTLLSELIRFSANLLFISHSLVENSLKSISTHFRKAS